MLVDEKAAHGEISERTSAERNAVQLISQTWPTSLRPLRAQRPSLSGAYSTTSRPPTLIPSSLSPTSNQPRLPLAREADPSNSEAASTRRRRTTSNLLTGPTRHTTPRRSVRNAQGVGHRLRA
jgi:hypothetical protein